jgi:hypothetical protein
MSNHSDFDQKKSVSKRSFVPMNRAALLKQPGIIQRLFEMRLHLTAGVNRSFLEQLLV